MHLNKMLSSATGVSSFKTELWIIQAGGMGDFGRNVNTAATRGGSIVGGAAGASAGDISGKLMGKITQVKNK
jgi:hypothetical protein